MLWRNPLALEAFGWECFSCYYLSQHAAYVRRELVRYLAAPSAADVLDRVVDRSSTPGASGPASAERHGGVVAR